VTTTMAVDRPDTRVSRTLEAELRGLTFAARNRLRRLLRPALPSLSPGAYSRHFAATLRLIRCSLEHTVRAVMVPRCPSRPWVSTRPWPSDEQRASHTIDEHYALNVKRKNLTGHVSDTRLDICIFVVQALDILEEAESLLHFYRHCFHHKPANYSFVAP
jgi:hypothetical protein